MVDKNEETCKYLRDNYNYKIEKINEFGNPAYMIDNIINFGIPFKPKKVEIINGIKVSSLEDILELKLFLNRNKDKKDIIKIRERIENKNNYKSI